MILSSTLKISVLVIHLLNFQEYLGYLRKLAISSALKINILIYLTNDELNFIFILHGIFLFFFSTTIDVVF